MSAVYPLVRNLSAFSTRSGVRASPSRVGSSPSSSSSCRMTFCMAVFYILLFALPGLAAAQTDPDALYKERANPARAKQAAALWEMRLKADARDFESAWKLARTMYWLGGHDVPDARRAALERGIEAARQAAQLMPGRPEGHFWMAANMGSLAESFGMRQGLKYRGPIRDALQLVLKIDPAYQDGSADRALGRWYFKVPGFFGGSKTKSEEHLRKSLTYNQNSHSSRFFLAETLFAMNRDADARDELKKILAAPIDPEWAAEDREFKKKAETLLSR